MGKIPVPPRSQSRGVCLPRPGQPIRRDGPGPFGLLARRARSTGLGKRLSERTARSPHLVGRSTAWRVRRPSSPHSRQRVCRRPGDRCAPEPGRHSRRGDRLQPWRISSSRRLESVDRTRRDAAPTQFIAAVSDRAGGPCDAARRLWGIPPAQPVDWVAGIVPRSAEACERRLPAKAGFTS